MGPIAVRRAAALVAICALVLLGTTLAGPSAEAATTGWFQTSSIPVGISAYGAAFDASTRTAYFSDLSGHLAVVDAATGTLTTTVSYGPGNSNGYVLIGLNDVTHKIYAANSDDTVSVIDTTTNTVIDTIPVTGGPDGVAVNSATDTIYVGGAGSVLAVIDGATDTVTDYVTVGIGAISVAADPAHDLVYTANSADGTVSVVDTSTNAVTYTVPLPAGNPQGVVADPATGKAYVSASDGNVYVLDGLTGTITATITGGSAPYAGAINHTTDTLFIPDYNNGTVTLIDLSTDTITDTVSGIDGADGIAVDESTNMVYAAASNVDAIAVVQQVTSPMITGLDMTNAVVGTPFSSTLGVSGGPGTTFAVTSGALPAGLALNAATGVVSGTPTGGGAFSFEIAASNPAGDDAQTFTGTVAVPPPSPPTSNPPTTGPSSGATADPIPTAVDAGHAPWSTQRVNGSSPVPAPS